MDLAGNADDFAGLLGDEAASVERQKQAGLDADLSATRQERENPTTLTGYRLGIAQRLSHWPSVFAWMIFAAIVGSIWAMRAKRPRVAWKLVLITPVVFLPMLLVHGLLPVFPWWALDAAGVIALVAIWSYTERYRWGYTRARR